MWRMQKAVGMDAVLRDKCSVLFQSSQEEAKMLRQSVSLHHWFHRQPRSVHTVSGFSQQRLRELYTSAARLKEDRDGVLEKVWKYQDSNKTLRKKVAHKKCNGKSVFAEGKPPANGGLQSKR